jgi:hypothetical protein
LRLSAWILLPALLLCGGCGIDREKGILMAAGSYGDLAVMMSDDGLRPVADRFLADMNTEMTFVIKPETLFRPDFFGPRRWEHGKGYKNVLMMVRIGDGGGVEKNARRLMSDAAWEQLVAGGGGVVKIHDPWNTYQFAVVVASRDRNNLSAILLKNAAKIREMIAEANRDRILRRNRYDGLNTAVMDALWRRHGFFLEVPGEYAQNQTEPDGFPGVELMRTGPSRGISISWFETDDPDALMADREALVALREDMGARLHDEEIIPSTFRWSAAERAGVAALKLEGAWTGRRFTGGGAFWCYFIPDRRAGRVICLDLLVYAPGLDKMDFFRRMDAVSSTFSLERPRP